MTILSLVVTVAFIFAIGCEKEEQKTRISQNEIVNLGSVPIEAKEPEMEMKPDLLSKFSKVKIGMTHDEVIELMGEPTDSFGSGVVWDRYKIGEGWYIELSFFSINYTLTAIRIVDYPGNREFKVVTDKADMLILDYPK